MVNPDFVEQKHLNTRTLALAISAPNAMNNPSISRQGILALTG
jgi:hypothetical protein